MSFGMRGHDLGGKQNFDDFLAKVKANNIELVQLAFKKSMSDIDFTLGNYNPGLGYYIGKYNTWSTYTPEDKGITIAYASIHGNTAEAAKKMKEILEEKGAKKVAITDLSREDMAEAIEDAFRYDKIIFASSSYNMGLFPPMEQLLHHLEAKNYQGRKVGIIENGTWAPSAGKCMKAEVMDEDM